MRNNTLLVSIFALTLVACGDSPTAPGSNPNPELNLLVATLAADGVAEDVDMMAGMSGRLGTIGASSIASLLAPPDGPGNTNGCGFGGGRWNCPPNSANGLTLTRTIAFFDGDSATQEEFDAETTARIEIDATLEGDVSRGPWSAGTFRHRELSVTGLEGTETERTTNGTGEVDVERFREAGDAPERSYDMEGEIAFVDVVIPVRAEGVDPWPTSGTITRIYTVVRDGGDPVVRTVVVVFDGTSTPPATVNGEPFELDLERRRASRRL
jgi:hypothetical protein